MSARYTRRTAIQRGLLAASSLGAGWLALSAAPRACAQGERQDREARLADANLAFGFRLFGQLAAAGTPNTFLSPLSVSIALAMAANGARGATRQAMLDALALGHMDLPSLNRASAALIAGLGARDPQVHLAIADSIWTRQGLPVRQSFVQALKASYSAQAASLDFTDPHAPAVINAWVRQKTHGLIPTIITTIPPEAVMYLINALYFKASWTQPFPTYATRQQPFTLLGGKPAQVPLMANHGMYPYDEDATRQAIALPYAGGKFSMIVLLPAAGTDFAAFQKGLTTQTWSATVARLQQRSGAIALPRFTVTYSATLNAALSALGMGIAFSRQADFGAMFVNVRAMISAVLHKTVMKVDEAGTTAAAVTSVGVTSAIAMPTQFTMTVNRPFFCAIRDNTAGVLLFMGAITDPR